MANNFASLIPILIEEESIPFLRRRGGLISKLFSTRQQTQAQRGGESVKVTMPNSPTATQDVSYVTAPAPQDFNLPSTTITFNQHKQRKISISELEARVAQGNRTRLLAETLTGMMDDLIFGVEQYVAGVIWPLLPIIGANNKDLSDTTMRAAMKVLMDNRIDPRREQVVFRGTTKQYATDLLSIDRYVLANNTGQGVQGGSESPIISGLIPSLYNVDADWSMAMPSQTFSGASTEIGVMFEKHVAAVGFLNFPSMSELSDGSAPVSETFTVDPESGITIRWQWYADVGIRSAFLQADVCYGANVLDATRGITILSKS